MRAWVRCSGSGQQTEGIQLCYKPRLNPEGGSGTQDIQVINAVSSRRPGRVMEMSPLLLLASQRSWLGRAWF